VKDNQKRKIKVGIIGAGIAGLTAGIYCLDQAFDVYLYEKNPYVGGECVGWFRKGTYIEGCAHWIVGTNPNSELYPLWKHVGAFDDNPIIYPTEYFTKFILLDGRTFTFYSNLDKLHNELITFFPEDKTSINKLIKGVKAYLCTCVPVKKPIDLMNIFELSAYGLRVLPMLFTYIKARRTSIEDFANKLNNKSFKDMIVRLFSPGYNLHSLFYVLQELEKDNAGIIEGGSIKMVEKIKKHFINAGGHLFLNKPAKRVVVEKKKAKGIEFIDGEKNYFDYVVACCDIHHTFADLLENKFNDKVYNKQFNNREAFPINTSILISYRGKGNYQNKPKMLDVSIEEIDLFGEKLNHFPIRNFSFDPSLKSKEQYTLFTCLIPASEKIYDYLKNLSKEEYRKEKEKLGHYFLPILAKYYGDSVDEFELLDVATPLTYERYNNCYKGSYMAYVATKDGFGLIRSGKIKNLSNFFLGGQWIMVPGGLPIALFSGKYVAIRIAKDLKRKFVNKEEKVVKNYKLSVETS